MGQHCLHLPRLRLRRPQLRRGVPGLYARGVGSTATGWRRSSSAAASTAVRRAHPSGSASSVPSTRATPVSTSSAPRSSTTSSRSTAATTPAGRSGRTRTSACRALPTQPDDSVWMQRFGAFMAKKHRLGADRWGTNGVGDAAVTDPVRQLFDREFPTFQPYPWGRQDWVTTLLINVMMAPAARRRIRRAVPGHE